MSQTLLQQVARTVAARDLSGRVAELNYLLRHMLSARGSISSARHAITHDPAAPTSVVNVIKAPISAMELSNSALDGGKWVLGAFNEAQRSASAFDAMLGSNSFVRVPIDQRGAYFTTGASAGEVGEGAVKFVSQPVITGKTLRPRKVAGIIIVSEELARSTTPSVAGTLGRELTGAVGSATDTAFVNMLIAAGITVTATAGPTAANVLTNIATLLTNVVPRTNSRLAFWTTPAVAAKLTTMADTSGGRAFPGATPTGGELAGMPLLVSDGVPPGFLILIDGSKIIANSDEVEIDASSNALIAMNDAPDSPENANTVMTSLWQSNLNGMMAHRFFGAEALSSNAAAAISGM